MVYLHVPLTAGPCSDGNPVMDRELGTLIHPDVHSISVHPSSPDLVTAPTGGGLYRSTGCGRTWGCLYNCYCRSAWVDPADPEHILFGPADGVSDPPPSDDHRALSPATWTF